MKVFLRTLVITLIICAGCFAYTHIKNASYSPVMKPNDTTISESKKEETAPLAEEAKVAPEKKEKIVKVCFMTNENTLKYVDRLITDDKKSLDSVISLLLKGPTEAEKQLGIYSEIPQSTRLLSVKEDNGSLIINLSESFAQGGGATSIMNRIGQLVKTIDQQNVKKPVYLYLNGKKVQYIGGEGVYLEQPLNN